MYRTLLFEISEGVARVTLNRPQSLNSLNVQMLADLKDVFDGLNDDSRVRCVVLTGSGRGFCSGADLTSTGINSADEISRSLRESYNPVIMSICAMEKPVIAAVNGVAAGAGCNMALACDLVVAAESAIFLQAFVKIGLVPDAGGSYFLPRLVGLKKAMEMALLGEKISAAEAVGLGMINRAVPDSRFEEEVNSLASRLASGPYCQGLIKKMFNLSNDLSLEGCLEMEADYQGRAAVSGDCGEGVQAFLEKRKAMFEGR